MENRCPECGTTLPRGVPAWARQLTVADAMTKDPVTLGPEDSLMKAVEVMRKRGIRRPPQATNTYDSANRVMEQTQISRIMIQNPMTTTEHVPLLDAAQTLHTTKFGALPVLRDGKLVGILTDSDLVGILVGLLSQGG